MFKPQFVMVHRSVLARVHELIERARFCEITSVRQDLLGEAHAKLGAVTPLDKDVFSFNFPSQLDLVREKFPKGFRLHVTNEHNGMVDGVVQDIAYAWYESANEYAHLSEMREVLVNVARAGAATGQNEPEYVSALSDAYDALGRLKKFW